MAMALAATNRVNAAPARPTYPPPFGLPAGLLILALPTFKMNQRVMIATISLLSNLQAM